MCESHYPRSAIFWITSLQCSLSNQRQFVALSGRLTILAHQNLECHCKPGYTEVEVPLQAASWPVKRGIPRRGLTLQRGEE